MFNKRPHPAATRVFVNWLLSKDVQNDLAKVLEEVAAQVEDTVRMISDLRKQAQ